MGALGNTEIHRGKTSDEEPLISWAVVGLFFSPMQANYTVENQITSVVYIHILFFFPCALSSVVVH